MNQIIKLLALYDGLPVEDYKQQVAYLHMQTVTLENDVTNQNITSKIIAVLMLMTNNLGYDITQEKEHRGILLKAEHNIYDEIRGLKDAIGLLEEISINEADREEVVHRILYTYLICLNIFEFQKR
ncbi:TPA: hypothetical protein ACF9H6_002105 [Staphylococcus aureus]